MFAFMLRIASTHLLNAPSTHLLNASRLVAARAALHAGRGSAHQNASWASLQRQLVPLLASNATWSVMDKNLTLPGISPHNYVSIGIYNHPCNALPKGCKAYPPPNPPLPPPSACDNATGLPWVPCDGIRNPSAIASGDAPAQSAMVAALVKLGIGAFYARNASLRRACVVRGAAIAGAWFVEPATRMIPCLGYGQIMPSATVPQKGHGGFIEWAHTAHLVDALELLRWAASKGGAEGSAGAACSTPRWFPGIEVHDVHPHVDMANAEAPRSSRECFDLCCATKGCVAFMFTTNQSKPAGNCSAYNTNASRQDLRCCWLKPTINLTRLGDDCRSCTSGIMQQPQQNPSWSAGESAPGQSRRHRSRSRSRRSDSMWPVELERGLRTWWRALREWTESKPAQGERKMTNNHGSWYDVTWSSMALYSANVTSAIAASREVETTRIAMQILPNGSEWIELERAVPSGYCQYNLDALSQAADLARDPAVRVDAWTWSTSDGRSLRKAIDWLTRYATNTTPWPYPQPTAPDWIKMFATLRRASVALGVAKYERDACEVMARMGKLKDYEEEMLNLMVPARYEFEHGESSGSCVATPSVRTATSAVVSNSPPSLSPPSLPPPPAASVAKTHVAISGAASPQWMINGVVTAKGSAAEGLLLNARLIQGIFDDDNEATRVNWAYPDTQVWDATRNTDELIGNLSSYVANGMRALTVGLQGGR